MIFFQSTQAGNFSLENQNLIQIQNYTIAGLPDYVHEYVQQNSQPQGKILKFLENNKIPQGAYNFTKLSDFFTSALRRHVLYESVDRPQASQKQNTITTILLGTSLYCKLNNSRYLPLSAALLGATIGNLFNSDSQLRVLEKKYVKDNPEYSYEFRFDDNIALSFGNGVGKYAADYCMISNDGSHYFSKNNAIVLRTSEADPNTKRCKAAEEIYQGLSQLSENQYIEHQPQDKPLDLSSLAEIYHDALCQTLQNSDKLPQLGFRYYWLQGYRTLFWSSVIAGTGYLFRTIDSENTKAITAAALGLVSAKYLSNMFGEKRLNKKKLQFIKNLRESKAIHNHRSLPNTWWSWLSIYGNDTY